MSGKQGEWSMIGVNAGVCEGECMRCSPGDEPLKLDEIPQLWVVTAILSPFVAEPTA